MGHTDIDKHTESRNSIELKVIRFTGYYDYPLHIKICDAVTI